MGTESQPLNRSKDGRSVQSPFVGENYIVSDGTTRRVVLGLRGDGNYGLRVSRPTVDVMTGGSVDMVMDSQFKNLKIIGGGIFSVTVPGSPVAGTNYRLIINYITDTGLPYIPTVIVQLNQAAGWGTGILSPLPYTFYGTPSAGVIPINGLTYHYTDISSLYINILSAGNANDAGVWMYKVLILAETANT